MKEARAREFGNMIRQHREMRGLTNHELAIACGVSDNTVERWILGDRRPGPASLATLISLLGLAENVSP